MVRLGVNRLTPVAPAGRLVLLDGLRGLAALGVVLYHFMAYPHELGWGLDAAEVFPRASSVAAYGAFGVQMFFIISGFVILMSAWGKPTAHFVASRIARLFPAYWAAVLITGVGFYWLAGWGVNGARVAANLTMLQTPFGVKNIDGAYWTLWVELCFYILVGLLLARGASVNKVLLFIGLWPLAGALASAGGMDSVALLLQPTYAPLFAGGMGLFIIYRFGHSFMPWLLVAFNVCLAVMTAATKNVPLMNKSLDGLVDGKVAMALIVILFALVATATLTRARSWGGAPAMWSGRLTYPLYLFHQYWGLGVIAVLYPLVGKWSALLAAVIVCVLIAWLVNRFVERPLAGRMRRWVLDSLARDQRA